MTREPLDLASWLEILVMAGAAILVAEIAWFLLLWPLGPVTVRAALVEAALPLPILAYAYLVYRVIDRIAKSELNAVVARVLATGAALSVGVLVFCVLVAAETHFRNDFGYRTF